MLLPSRMTKLSVSPASELVVKALQGLPKDAYSVSPRFLTPLHEHVCALVGELKGAGIPPEQVVLTVRRLADQARLPYAASNLVDRLVSVCIEQYFSEPTR